MAISRKTSISCYRGTSKAEATLTFEAGFGESSHLRNRKAADWAGTRVNGQIEKFILNGYQIAGVIAIAGGSDV